MKTMKYKVATVVIVAVSATQAFASTVLNCSDSLENIKIDTTNVTIERDGVTYGFIPLKSSFGLALKPENPRDGHLDLGWSILANGVTALEDIQSAESITLNTNYPKSTQTPLSCGQIDQ